MKKTIVLSLIILFTAGCGIIVSLTKSKNGSGELVNTTLSQEANAYFWEQLHNGNYENIPLVIDQLHLALAANPNDLVSTAHLGFVHVWALSERQRLAQPQASITEHIYLSKRYFEEAFKMNPHDPRLLGFLADMTIAEGNVLGDKRQVTAGFFEGLKSIKMWPQFNQFSIGYILSTLDTSDANYKKALDWQYNTISDCACEKLDKDSDYKAAIEKIKTNTDRKIARACWNSWIAPHNWEGFCLNFGDMLTKKGDVAEAIKIYNLARLSDGFDSWPFKGELENRIAQVNENVVAFNQPLDERNLKSQSVILFNSKISCVSCHQMGENDMKRFSNHKGLDETYYFPKKNAF
jgi:uncharacterized protein YceK